MSTLEVTVGYFRASAATGYCVLLAHRRVPQLRSAQQPFEDSIINSEEGDPTAPRAEYSSRSDTGAAPPKKTVILIRNILCVKDLPIVD